MTFVACEQDGISISFNVDYTTEFTIDANSVTSTGGIPVDINTPSVSTSGSTVYGDNNTNIDKIESAKLKTLSISITAPNDEDFSFISEVKLYVTGQGLSEELVASKSNIDGTATSIDLDVQDVELADHIKAGEFSTRVSVTTNETITDDVEMKADMQFKITATAL
ncbi:MAG: hypothetical protein COA58_07045 [Bacteroidetes bacterium]|nr:MAG: hypothetical protein COA58_07045 [Bacteroidota bacterium]